MSLILARRRICDKALGLGAYNDTLLTRDAPSKQRQCVLPILALFSRMLSHPCYKHDS